MNKSISVCFCVLGLVSVPAWGQGEIGFIEVENPVFATIAIDGQMNDWAGIEPAYRDTIGDNQGSQFDFAAAYLANDNDYLYIRVSFAGPAPFGEVGWLTNIVFNTDLDGSTGFGFAGVTGSEFFIQSGGIFDQRSGDNFVDVFEKTPENNYGAFAFADTQPFDTTTDIELRVARDLTFSDDENGMPGLLNPDDSPIFPFDDFLVLFEAEDESFTSVEFMPNPDPSAGGLNGLWYTFAQPPAAIDAWFLYDE